MNAPSPAVVKNLRTVEVAARPLQVLDKITNKLAPRVSGSQRRSDCAVAPCAVLSDTRILLGP